MGWASGSELADDLWKTVEKHLPKDKQKKIAKKWVDIFEQEDCDTMYETKVAEIAGVEFDD